MPSSIKLYNYDESFPIEDNTKNQNFQNTVKAKIQNRMDTWKISEIETREEMYFSISPCMAKQSKIKRYVNLR